MSDSEVKIRFPADASNATRAVQGATTATHGLAGAMNGARDAINGASRAIGLFRRALGVIGWISSIVGMLISAWQALPEKTQRAREGGKGRQREAKGSVPFFWRPRQAGPSRPRPKHKRGLSPFSFFLFRRGSDHAPEEGGFQHLGGDGHAEGEGCAEEGQAAPGGIGEPRRKDFCERREDDGV